MSQNKSNRSSLHNIAIVGHAHIGMSCASELAMIRHSHDQRIFVVVDEPYGCLPTDESFILNEKRYAPIEVSTKSRGFSRNHELAQMLKEVLTISP